MYSLEKIYIYCKTSIIRNFLKFSQNSGIFPGTPGKSLETRGNANEHAVTSFYYSLKPRKSQSPEPVHVFFKLIDLFILINLLWSTNNTHHC